MARGRMAGSFYRFRDSRRYIPSCLLALDDGDVTAWRDMQAQGNGS
jgi:hypothetical protein